MGEGPGYSVHMSSDPLHTELRAKTNGQNFKADKGVIICRIKRMSPEPASPHLARFKQEFGTHKRYLLIPVSSNCEPLLDYAIGKAKIYFRQASEITSTDLDAVVFPENYFDHDGTLQ